MNEYRKECDTISLFIEDALDKDGKSLSIKTSDLYLEYEHWCVNRELEKKSQKEFVAELRDKDLISRIGNKGNTVKGYKWKVTSESVDEYIEKFKLKKYKDEGTNYDETYTHYKNWVKNVRHIPVSKSRFQNLLKKFSILEE